jgi:arabinogalactan oligomer/maltooligosaccharide transport system permease protein
VTTTPLGPGPDLVPPESAGSTGTPTGRAPSGRPSTPVATSRSTRNLLLKVVVLGVVDALGLFGIAALWANHSWKGLAAMVVAVVAVNLVYWRKGALPAKYLLPGLIPLLIFQVYVVLYTGYAAFTNYGDGHNSTKADAVAAILAGNQTRVPDSPAYPLKIVRKDGQLGFLVTDPTTKQAELGTATTPLAPAAEAQKDASGQAAAVPGWTTLGFNDILAAQQQVTALRVPISGDPNAGTIGTQDGSTGYVFKSTYRYDAGADQIRDTSKGTVYVNDGKGEFRSADGKALTPGWKVYVGFQNFTKVLTDSSIRGPFVGVFVWTFVFAGLSVALTFAVGLVLALTLNDERMRGRKVYRSLLILPYAIPAFLSALVFAGMLNTRFGIINSVLLGGAEIPWLTDPWLARLSVLLVNTWLGFPYMFLVTTGALQAIPKELTEASAVDGASPFQSFRQIKLPLLLVSLAPLLISSFAFNFNNFNTIYMLTGGGPKDLNAPVDVGATDILISFVYKLAFGGTNRQYGFACAVSILIFVIIATISGLLFRRTRALEELN